ncbi:MAG TPA: S-layer homology domain-containing protein [Candidatus Flavonifractor merdigallinarum]|uniref:S-layer homology domain-containing protein n=1 Tax=Candidatus Flavonifractor merdigallinarum TaxID=2838589 RepID=A0A9D2BXL0_9FIRM|nr:S-layer homology domain-containing protein [Candidatus Flavonifractor merdigallinarum]
MFRRIAGLLLAASVALGTLPTAAFAATPLPSSYDLRTENAVTPARNQGRYGDCWAFAAMAALESAILKQNVDSSVTASTLDLSEDHMDRHHGYDYGPRLAGGRYELALSYLLRGDGPYLESDYPYTLPPEATSSTPTGSLPVPAEATPSNPTIPYQVLGVQFLENVNALELTADTAQAAIAPTKEAIRTYGAVSTNLYQAHDGKGTFPYTNGTYYNPEKAAYYCDEKAPGYNHVANHAVAIVGWDDHFSKENFTTKPDFDGAWLCKDAQGTGFGRDGFYWVSYQSACVTTTQFCFTEVVKADQAYSGIAQHDALGLTQFVDNDYTQITGGQDVYFNRFTAPASETTLEAAGFYTMGKNASYRLYFIPDFDEFIRTFTGYDDVGPTFQEKQNDYLIQSGTLADAGYHTISLEKPIQLTQNQDYGIGLWVDFPTPISYMPWTQSKPDRGSGHYVFEYACSLNPIANPVVAAGETYTFDPSDNGMGIFNGLGSGDTIEDVGYTDQSYGMITFGNLCLKGYYSGDTSQVDPTPETVTVTSVTQPSGLTVPYGTDASALSLPNTVRVQLSNGKTEELTVTWNTSSYQATNPGVQTLIGTLTLTEGMTNPQNLNAQITVTVEEPVQTTVREIVAVSSPSLSLTETELYQNPTACFEDSASVLLSDGTHTKLQLVDAYGELEDALFDLFDAEPGVPFPIEVFTLQLPSDGSITNPKNLTPTVMVVLTDGDHLPSITSAQAPAPITVPLNTAAGELGLPEQVSVTLSDQTTAQATVNWYTGSYQAGTAGQYTISGLLTAPDNAVDPTGTAVSITVTVEAPAPQTLTIESVTQPSGLTVSYGTDTSALNLPNTVRVQLSNSQTEELTVTWNTSSYQATTPGTQTLTGTFTLPDGITNPQNLTAQLSITVERPASQTLPAPTISPNGDSFTGSQTVTLTCAQEGAQIYYTLNGTQPTRSAILYTGPFALTQSATIRAFAVLDGWIDSPVSSAQFTYSTPSGGGTSDSSGRSDRDSDWSPYTQAMTTVGNDGVQFKPNVTTQDSVSSVSLSQQAGQELIRQSANRGSRTAILAPAFPEQTERVRMTLHPNTLTGLGNHTEADLMLVTPLAELTLPNRSLTALGSHKQSLSVEVAKADHGVSVTLVAGEEPVLVSRGYTLSIPHDDCTPGTVAILVGEDGTRTVVRKSMVDEAENTVTLTLNSSAQVDIVNRTPSFSDVSEQSWMYDSVTFAYAHELFAGTGENQFSPQMPMARGMLAQVLYNLEGNPNPGSISFPDVSDQAWYAPAARWSAQARIFSGYSNGNFGPEDPITREQLAVALYRYAGSPQSQETLSAFPDYEEISPYARSAFAWAVENGLFQGTGSGTLAPQAEATRAQVAQVLMSFCQQMP